MACLHSCDCVTKHQNILISAPCGSCETYLACPDTYCGLKSSQRKILTAVALIDGLSQHKADGGFSKVLKPLARYGILILDDFGVEPLKATQRNV